MNEMTTDKTFTETHEMIGKCPFGGDRVGGAFGTPPTLENWYPDRLRVELLHQNGLAADPLGPDFDYAAEFAKLDFEALKRDIKQFLTTSVGGTLDDYNPISACKAYVERLRVAGRDVEDRVCKCLTRIRQSARCPACCHLPYL